MNTCSDQAPEILSYQQAADWLGVPLGTLYCWVHEQRVPYFRLGPRTVRFSRSDLQKWLNASRMNPLYGGTRSKRHDGQAPLLAARDRAVSHPKSEVT